MVLTEIGRGSKFFRAVGRQDHAVKRETSWGIMKLRVDGGHAIDVHEALAVIVAVAVAGVGAKRA
jgi:hypothetical protein